MVSIPQQPDRTPPPFLPCPASGALWDMAQSLALIASQLEQINGRLDCLEPAVADLYDAVQPFLRFNGFFQSEQEARVAHRLFNIAVHGLDTFRWSAFPEDTWERRVARLTQRVDRELGKADGRRQRHAHGQLPDLEVGLP